MRGKCAICEKHQDKFDKALAVDHNHINGKIRGLLCSVCNRMLGFLKVDETDKIVNNILKYLGNK